MFAKQNSYTRLSGIETYPKRARESSGKRQSFRGLQTWVSTLRSLSFGFLTPKMDVMSKNYRYKWATKSKLSCTESQIFKMLLIIHPFKYLEEIVSLLKRTWKECHTDILSYSLNCCFTTYKRKKQHNRTMSQENRTQMFLNCPSWTIVQPKAIFDSTKIFYFYNY